MEFLKHYFARDHRMNRKPFVLILIAFFVVGMISAGITMSQIPPGQKAAINNLVQQKIQHKITEEQYQQSIKDMQADMQKSIPAFSYIMYLVMALLLLPAIAMRLQDMNYNPALALLFVILPSVQMAARLSDALVPSALFVIGSTIELILKIVLALVRGTKGPNRYGTDPLEAGI